MGELWYTLSSNVLEAMINFASTQTDGNCPKFLFEIKSVSSSMNRYFMNLIDGSKKCLFCVTSAEYSKNFPFHEAIAGKIIRILHYWLFDVENDLKRQRMYENKYIVIISNAEIIKFAPSKPIASLTRFVSKTPRIRGIVNSCSGVSNTKDGGLCLRFYLRDNTGSIGCTVFGTLCILLDPLLKDGIKLEISHAMVKEIDETHKMSDSNFELRLNKFSVINIYNFHDLSPVYTYPNHTVDKKTISDNSPIVNLSHNSLPVLHNEHIEPLQKCSNGRIPIPVASLSNSGICTLWIRGIIECYHGIAATRVNTVFMRFHIRDHSNVIHCTVWEPICTPLSTVIKEGFIVEIANANVRPVPKMFMISDLDFDIVLNKFSTIKAFASNGSLLYEYIKQQSIFMTACENESQSTSSNSSRRLMQKNNMSKLAVNISCLAKEGYCNLWIKGIVCNYAGKSCTRSNRFYTHFYLHDDTSIIHCTVWEPTCSSIHEILKDGMLLEINHFKVTSARNDCKFSNHGFELHLNEYSTIEIYTANGTLLRELGKS